MPDPALIRGAWAGRVSGCLLGKPLEVLSFKEGPRGVESYLRRAGAWPLEDYVRAWPLEDYVPALAGTPVEALGEGCCRGAIERAEPDDDINYTVLALMLLEEHGTGFDTVDVARAWLRLLPAGGTWTAERAAYRTLLDHMDDEFVNGADPGFDIARCADNEFSDWIGAQIRADLYGWVCPARPELAAELACRDAALSHRGEGIHGAAFIAALGAAIPMSADVDSAIDVALGFVPESSAVADAVDFGRTIAGQPDAVLELHQRYCDLSPVHAVNNLALVVWALCAHGHDFGAAIGSAVSAGWDTDCNGATVGGLAALAGAPIAESWTRPWQGRIGLSIAGVNELSLDDVVRRTVAVAQSIGDQDE